MIQIKIKKTIKGEPLPILYALTIESAKIIGISGPSGQGKTTFFDIISGIQKAEEEFICINGTTLADHRKKTHLKPQKRNIGYVFQDYALFPTMTVLDNINFGKNEILTEDDFQDILSALEITHILSKNVEKLSGGQKQRVAIARSLVQLPQLLLMDEPFAALDHQIKEKIIHYLSDYCKSFSISILINSHQIEELHLISDKVYHLSSSGLKRSNSLNKKLLFEGTITAINKENKLAEVTINGFSTTLPLQATMKIGQKITTYYH